MNNKNFKALIKAIDKIQDDTLRNEVLQALCDYQAAISINLHRTIEILHRFENSELMET